MNNIRLISTLLIFGVVTCSFIYPSSVMTQLILPLVLIGGGVILWKTRELRWKVGRPLWPLRLVSVLGILSIAVTLYFNHAISIGYPYLVILALGLGLMFEMFEYTDHNISENQ